MSSVQLITWIATAVFIVLGLSKFIYSYTKGRNEILKRDYSKENNTENLLKQLYEMADINDKDNIENIINDNIDYIYDENIFKEDSFDFKISDDFKSNDTFFEYNYIYTATKGSEDNYIVTAKVNSNDEEVIYKDNQVKNYIENKQWIIV